MNFEDMSKVELIRLLQEHERSREESGKDGIVLSYSGRTAPWQITHMVKPKLTSILKEHSIGDEEYQAENILIEGENLSSMVTLYKYREQVDLIVTDPPYNTGEDFRYNDKWDKDPNDPDLGELVPEDDGSRHSKWLRFMTPRLWMMKEMLKPGGVLAICIDERELFRLGMIMDEIFREENRIGIINWQKSYAPRSDNKHLSTSTEYVLVYTKNIEKAKSGLNPRTVSMDSKYKNPDNDEYSDWRNDNATAASGDKKSQYGIQSPFTGRIYYPGDRYWANGKSKIKEWLEAWGFSYQEKDIGDSVIHVSSEGRTTKIKALVLKGCQFENGEVIDSDNILISARANAKTVLERGNWPQLYFGLTGETGPQIKRYLKDVKKGKVPMTYWADEEYDTPLYIDSQSWDHEESGHSQAGINELDAVVGKGHNFRTVKPLRLIKKIIQLWCKPDGIVVDPFAGSGTTAHAVIELNHETDANRKFILIEQGNAETGDHYASSLTAERIKRVLTGDWANGKRESLPGGFRYVQIKNQLIDADAVKALAREEMVDLLLTSYWDKSERSKSYLKRVPIGESNYLFGVNSKNEGFYLVWDAAEVPSVLDRDNFRLIAEESKKLGLSNIYHVYASLAPYSGRNVNFYKIPDKVLEHIGFSMRTDAYNNDRGEASV